MVDWYLGDIRSDYTIIEFNVPDAEVTIADTVSGQAAPLTFAYDSSTNVSASSPSRVQIPAGLEYTIYAKTVRPSFPFDSSFQINVARNGPGNPSLASASWFIPVLGVVTKELPNVYPVSSDPNLIFLVLRDPPGALNNSLYIFSYRLYIYLNRRGKFGLDSIRDNRHFWNGNS